MARRGPVAEPVRIEKLSHEGRGIARIGGKTAFLDDALPGELVRAFLTRRRGRFDEGFAEEVLEPSPRRTEPPCVHYGVCGGCALQHLGSDDQLAHKQSVLLELLERDGALPGEVLAPLRGPTLGYRRKARLAVKRVPKKGGVLVGFRERRSPYVADIRSCPVLHPGVGERLTALRELIASLSVASRVPQLEIAVGDSERPAVILRHLEPLTPADRDRLAEFAAAEAMDFYLQPGGVDSIEPLAAAAALRYALPAHDIEIAFEPQDFTQVNFAINRALVDRVVELVDPRPGEQCLDMFCGLGNFTLPLARRGGNWLGLEGAPELVERARGNALRNGLDGVRFEAVDLAATPLPAIVSTPADKVLVDPPRSGAATLLEALDTSRLARLVYVSCNPATLARDAGWLVRERGLRLRAAGVIDMFPHTAHVESLAVFEPA